MNIWFDLGHLPQYNFYKPVIEQLAKQGHKVYVTVLGRGKMPKIVQHELGDNPNIQIDVVGHHSMTKWSALIQANIIRNIQLLWWAMGKHISVAFSNIYQSAFIGWLLHFPNYCFGDDFRGIDVKLKRWFSTRSHYCIYEVPQGVIAPAGHEILRCTKEWAYLNPRTFHPNPEVLQRYGLQPKQYLFLREVSVGTVNYAAQSPQAILSISPLIQQFTQSCQTPLCNSSSSDPTITQKGQTPLCNIQENSSICTEGQSPCANFKVLFSLEEKNRRSEYPADWILLQEPIEDIHSLMYYAAGLVSSGDSMAREAALLGIPAYYLGVRHSMPANLAASKVANLQNETTQPFEQWLREVRGKSEEVRTREQEEARRKIDKEFIDINQYMLSLVEGEKEINR